MKNNLSCDTVQDLLPIYLDEIASEETNVCVKKHLSECQLCLNEYKKLCQIEEKKEEVVMNESASIKTLQKRIVTSFITTMILGIFLISIDMFCLYAESVYIRPTIFDLISILYIYVVKYLMPLLGIFVAMIWKKTISKKEKAFWPNVIISFLGIWVLVEVVFLVCHFYVVIMGH